MSVLLLIALLSQSPQAPAPPPTAQDDCIVQHFARQVSATGTPPGWVENKDATRTLKEVLGQPISDPELVLDGYSYHFHRPTRDADHVYVLQTGGLAGNVRVYGPFPLPHCTQSVQTTATRARGT